MVDETSRTNVLLEDMQRHLKVLAECYVSQTAKLESFDQRLINLEATTGRIEMRVGVLEAKVDKLEAKVDNLEIKVDKLEAKVDKLEAKVDKLEAKVDKLEAKVDNLEAKVDNLESFASDAKHRLTGLEDVAAETRGRLVRIEAHLGLHGSHRAPTRRARPATNQPSRTMRSKKR